MNAFPDDRSESGGFLDRYMPENGSHPAYPPEHFTIDFSLIRGILWRQRYIVAGLIGFAVLAGVIITLLATPLYSATATLRLNLTGDRIVEGQDLEPFVSSNEYARYSETLARVIESRSMALRVAESLQQRDHAILLGETAAELDEDDLRSASAAILSALVQAEAPIERRILSVTFYSTDPGFAARIANEYAEQFLEYNVTEGFEANSYALAYLQGQIEDVRERLRDSEVEMNAYARSNRIFGNALETGASRNDPTDGGATLSSANLGAINSQFVESRSRRLVAEQRWNAVALVPAEQLPEAMQDLTIQALRSDLADLEAELRDLRVRYRDEHPQVQELVARIAPIREQIGVQAEQIKAGIERDYEIALAQERAFDQELSRFSDRTLDEQDRLVQYNIMEREVGVLRNQLAVLLARYNEISSATNLRSNDVALLDTAVVPDSPYSPSLFRNLVISLALGIAAAVGLALSREILDDRVRSMEDVQRKVRLPALGQTPIATQLASDELNDPFSPIGEAYSTIRATLDFALQDIEKPVIQITSAAAGEGKTITAFALAQKYASLGKRTLLIDLDLRRPSVAKLAGAARSSGGLIDALHGRVPLQEALLPGQIENLDILCVGKIPANPVEILSSGLLNDFLIRERDDYDVIIMDSSPVMGIADAPLLSRFADAVVFIVEANRAHFGQTKAAIRRLREANARIAGIVLSKFRPLDAGENYNYQYRYYRYEPGEA
jgi:capsular exopolysaccharide synthesis family protein